MNGYSQAPKEERLKILQSVMPEIFDEGKIDWEKLCAVLGEDVNFADERYRLNWAGKSDAFRVMQVPSAATLHREIYRNGYIIKGIDASNGFVSFSNNEVLYQGQQQGGQNDEIMKFQIRRTIEEHLSKELKFNKKGRKVLSLFFIDRVANYRSYDAQGNTVKGKFAVWFEEIYNELIAKPIYQSLSKYPIEKIHNGYFSQDKKGQLKDTTGETQADDNTYNLIMRDKELLLDIDNSLRFIFSHTALRESWDNPNVFQICTLNETKSEMKKRQEIGRGLRLAVNQEDARIYDKNINRLTVVANEAYNDFAKALQSELKEDCGVDFGNRIKPKRSRVAVTYRKGFEADPMFLSIWEKLKTKTTYRVKYDTDELIKAAGKAIKNLPKIERPSIHSVKNEVVITEEHVTSQYKGDSTYEMRLFEDWETCEEENITFEVTKKDKTIYDCFMPLDSVVEHQFAKDCESSEQVKFYFKLPGWFKIPTPIGNYNPDWAVVFEDDRRIYFIAETKDTGTVTVDMSKLRPEEQAKIKCGVAHFHLFPDLEYQVVNSVNSLKK